MSKAQNGARIKAWAGPDVGSGIVRNITFQNFVEREVDNPVVIDQVRLSRRCFPPTLTATVSIYPSSQHTHQISNSKP